MSWTKGQSRRENQPPFIHQDNTGESTTAPVSNNYFKGNGRRADYSHRQAQHSLQPKDTAATFSHEGLQAFAHIFSSSVENAFTAVLPSLLDSAVSKHLHTFKDELLQSLSQMVADEVARTVDSHLNRHFEKPLPHPSAPAVDEQGLPGTGARQTRLAGEVALVCQQLKDIGRPVRTNELPSLLRGIRWSGNVSAKMTKLIHKSNGRIARTGRGLYQYTGV